MRESPKHTYFIIRAAMTCFFLVVPLFVLRAPLEWMGRMLAADGRITEWIWNQAYPQYMTRANPGGWIRSLFAGEGENGIPDPDPAYRELVRNRQFLEEHPYIKQRLAAWRMPPASPRGGRSRREQRGGRRQRDARQSE